MPSLGQDKPSRAYAISRFILELDGQNVGVLSSVDGGHFKSEGISQQVGAEGLVTRYPGRQKFDEIVVQCGTAMSPGFWSWIQKSIANNPQRRNGAIVACDFDGKERARRTFYDALISEIQFPACDAKAKSPAFITVKIAAERMEYQVQDGGVKTNPEAKLTKQKMWVPANYRLTLERIPMDITRHTVKIEALTIKQNIIANPIGKEKWARIEAGRVEHPGISIYVPETYVKSYQTWWKSFVGEMEHDAGNETTGSVAYLASDCTTELMTLSFKGIGITSLTFDKHEGSGEQIRTVKVDFYTETMEFSGGAGTGN